MIKLFLFVSALSRILILIAFLFHAKVGLANTQPVAVNHWLLSAQSFCERYLTKNSLANSQLTPKKIKAVSSILNFEHGQLFPAHDALPFNVQQGFWPHQFTNTHPAKEWPSPRRFLFEEIVTNSLLPKLDPQLISEALAQGQVTLDESVILPEAWPLYYMAQDNVGHSLPDELSLAFLVSPRAFSSHWVETEKDLERTQSLVIGYVAQKEVFSPRNLVQAMKNSSSKRNVSEWQSANTQLLDNKVALALFGQALKEVRIALKNERLTLQSTKLSLRMQRYLAEETITSYALSLRGSRSNREYVQATLGLYQAVSLKLLSQQTFAERR